MVCKATNSCRVVILSVCAVIRTLPLFLSAQIIMPIPTRAVRSTTSILLSCGTRLSQASRQPSLYWHLLKAVMCGIVLISLTRSMSGGLLVLALEYFYLFLVCLDWIMVMALTRYQVFLTQTKAS